VGVVEPVEVAHLVGAVVGAITRADAAVVDLPVEPVGRVIGGVHGTDRLAGRVAALLAQHRRHHRADRPPPPLFATRVIALDPHPAHLPAAGTSRSAKGCWPGRSPRALASGKTSMTPLPCSRASPSSVARRRWSAVLTTVTPTANARPP